MHPPYSLTQRLQIALRTFRHGFGYARHLVRGNRFTGNMSWVRRNSRPVVLVHGFLGTRGTMVPLTRRFQADGRVVFTYHHGTFQLDSMSHSANELSKQVCSLIDDLGIDRVDLVGFSMGGLVALHALKFHGGQHWIRRLAILGTPVAGTWMSLLGIATLGLVSPSVWQVRPGSRFLNQLFASPTPPGVPIRQIYAQDDAFCPTGAPIAGVDPERDYIVLPGGHSSLVIAQSFYNSIRDFLDRPELPTEQSQLIHK